jgi:hypothetical protein
VVLLSIELAGLSHAEPGKHFNEGQQLIAEVAG